MNGFIKKTIAALCLGGVTAISGCCEDCRLCDCYDNCWLARYSFMATQSDNAAFCAQIYNGHVLEQTVYTYHFELGTDVLTKGGQDHLAFLARRRPTPDTHIWLQTAQDVHYDAAAPEQYAAARADLDGKRIAAIQRFLNAEKAGCGLVFEVAVHDAPTMGLPTQAIGIAVGRFYNNFQGAMPAVSSVGVAGPGTGASQPR
jgi:hypothetical protein